MTKLLLALISVVRRIFYNIATVMTPQMILSIDILLLSMILILHLIKIEKK